MLRTILAAIALLAAACSPAAPTGETPPAAPATPDANADTQALLAALAPVVAQDIGQPVGFTVDTVRIQDDWAWLVAQPQAADGSGVDWSHSKYAEAASQGVLDGNGTTYALLKRENGRWRVLDFVIGPTDVAYADWPARYGAPPSVMGLPAQ